jgi:hypothetical protein
LLEEAFWMNTHCVGTGASNSDGVRSLSRSDIPAGSACESALPSVHANALPCASTSAFSAIRLCV